MIVAKEASAYEMVPRGYGCAWRNYRSETVMCYPIPLNLVMAVLHRAWYWLILPKGLVVRRSDYERGFRNGKREEQDRQEESSGNPGVSPYEQGLRDGMRFQKLREGRDPT